MTRTSFCEKAAVRKRLEDEAKTVEQILKEIYLEAGKDSKSIEEAWPKVATISQAKSYISIERALAILGEAVPSYKQLSKEKLGDELSRLAENCHDEIVKELAKHPFPKWHSGWAKVLSPIIWAWYERVFGEASSAKEGKK